MNILLASRQEEDRRSLQTILEGTHRTLTAAGSRVEAEQILHDLDVPIALCDRDLPGLAWPDMIRALRRPGAMPA
jgi:CheY-like chemotaxis protein